MCKEKAISTHWITIFVYICIFQKGQYRKIYPCIDPAFFSKISLILFLLPDVCYYKYPPSKCYIIYQNTSIQNNNHCWDN